MTTTLPKSRPFVNPVSLGTLALDRWLIAEDVGVSGVVFKESSAKV
jgi:hypothetical protein